MITLSYTTSPFLLKELETIEQIRNEMLLSLLSPKDEVRLRWEAMIERSIASLKLKGIYLKAGEVSTLLQSGGKGARKKSELLLVNYKKVYDAIRYLWMLNKEPLGFSDFSYLYDAFKTNSSIPSKDIKNALSFLQVNPEHPVLQSGIAYILFYNLLGHTEDAKVMALLLSYLFLYKNGYEFRGLLNLEEYFVEHAKAFQEIIDASHKKQNISAYLDHFILALTTQVEKARKRLMDKEFRMQYPQAFFELTTRQREILAQLDEPGSKITNRSVQKLFKVSQITASRDLARLASLGLLFAAGRGRSVYYTKA